MSRGARLVLALAIAAGAASPALAKKKKAPPPESSDASVKKKKEEKQPPPGDPAANEGAQGRINATVDESAAGAGPPNTTGRRP